MTKDNHLRCRWCSWSTPPWFTPKGGVPKSGFLRLRDHQEDEHEELLIDLQASLDQAGPRLDDIEAQLERDQRHR